MNDSLATRITGGIAPPVRPEVVDFAKALARDSGAIAVLFYGSNLRTGELAGVLDFYLLLPGQQREKIWPRVSYHEQVASGVTLRAKAAAMALTTFADACAGQLRDTTIWARFVQPSALIWREDNAVEGQVIEALSQAACTAARLAAALGPDSGTAQEYWRALFRATYKAEFRVERPGRENSILSVNEAHFDGLLPVALEGASIAFSQDGEKLTPQLSDKARRGILIWWRRRRRWGKPLNLIRLIKASTTFEGAGRYAAWKIERHTGVSVEITPWRERHPILAAPGVLFSVWRKRKSDERQ